MITPHGVIAATFEVFCAGDECQEEESIMMNIYGMDIKARLVSGTLTQRKWDVVGGLWYCQECRESS